MAGLDLNVVWGVALVLAYLLGSLPFGLWIGLWAGGVDVRTAGSGNIGATNVGRTVGRRWGLLTLVLDGLKGALAVGFAAALGWPAWMQAALGLMAVLGHVFSIFVRFRGGKGVATGAGVFFALAPRATLVALVAFGLVAGLTRTVGMGSLAGAATLVVAVFVRKEDPVVLGLSLVVAAVIFVRHRGNMRRWLARNPPGEDDAS